jgi:hypothetical protein
MNRDSFPPYGVHDDDDWENFMEISSTDESEFITDYEYLMNRKQFPQTKNEEDWIETNGTLLIENLRLLKSLNLDKIPKVAIYIDNTLGYPIIYFSPLKRLIMFINIKYRGHFYVLDLKKEFFAVMSITRGPIYNYFDIVEDSLFEEKTIKRNEYTKTQCIFAMNNKIFK